MPTLFNLYAGSGPSYKLGLSASAFKKVYEDNEKIIRPDMCMKILKTIFKSFITPYTSRQFFIVYSLIQPVSSDKRKISIFTSILIP